MQGQLGSPNLVGQARKPIFNSLTQLFMYDILSIKGEFSFRLFAHQILVGLRTNSSKCRWNLVAQGLCVPTKLIIVCHHNFLEPALNFIMRIIMHHKSSNPCKQIVGNQCGPQQQFFQGINVDNYFIYYCNPLSNT